MSSQSAGLPDNIQTARLLLRPYLLADRDDIFEYASQTAVTDWVRFATHVTKADTEKFLQQRLAEQQSGERIGWAIELIAERKVIGGCGFLNIAELDKRAEFGYVINPRYWSKGFATEAALAAVPYGFAKLGLHRIEAFTFPANTGSVRVLEKCGFRREGLLREREFQKGAFRDLLLYARLATD